MDNKQLDWMDFSQTRNAYVDIDRLKNNTQYLKDLVKSLNLEDIESTLNELEKQIPDLQTSTGKNTTDIASIQDKLTDIYNQIKTKQDLLDTKNAGTNITITKAKDGVTPLINAQVQIPDIDGNKIHGTINGQDSVLVEAITNNVQGIANNKELINKNTTDIASTNDTIKTLETTEAHKTDVDKKMNVFATGVNEFSDTDFSASGKFVKVQDGYNANLKTDGKTFSSAINDLFDLASKSHFKLSNLALNDTIDTGYDINIVFCTGKNNGAYALSNSMIFPKNYDFKEIEYWVGMTYEDQLQALPFLKITNGKITDTDFEPNIYLLQINI